MIIHHNNFCRYEDKCKELIIKMKTIDVIDDDEDSGSKPTLPEEFNVLRKKLNSLVAAQPDIPVPTPTSKSSSVDHVL